MFGRHEHKDISDFGLGHIPPDMPNTSWIDDRDVYPDTHWYRQVFEVIGLEVQKRNIIIKRYLGLGSGLGRQTVLAAEQFQDLSRLVAVDPNTPIHQSVITRFPFVEQVRLSVFDELMQLQSQQELFDILCFENIGDSNAMYHRRMSAYPALQDVVSPGGFVAALGDTMLLPESLEKAGFSPVPTRKDGESWRMYNMLWQKGR